MSAVSLGTSTTAKKWLNPPAPLPPKQRSGWMAPILSAQADGANPTPAAIKQPAAPGAAGAAPGAITRWKGEMIPMPPGNDDGRATLSVAEAARLLGIGRGTAYEAVHRGEIPSLRVGRRILVPRATVERLLADAGTRANHADAARTIGRPAPCPRATPPAAPGLGASGMSG